MPRTKTLQDHALLEAALEGLESQKERLQEQIDQVRSLLGRGTGRRGRPPANGTAPAVTKTRHLSPAARKRIAAAQKKRWAEYRKNNPASQA